MLVAVATLADHPGMLTAIVFPLLFAVPVAQQDPPAPDATAKSARSVPTDAKDRTPSDFVRFVRVDDGGHLDTAITTYRKGDVELRLYGAVHIADPLCYEALNDRFTEDDVLLYELVGPEDYRPTKDREERGFNPISLLQQGLKNSLELQFQLDAVDYLAPNFVHADMTPEEFQRSMQERGESLLSIMWKMMVGGMKAQLAAADGDTGDAGAAPAPSFDLVKAFRSGEGRHTLRISFASQMEQMEMLAAGAGDDGKGSTLLEGRNEKCLAVLAREMAAGRKRIGIYYGAAHLPHMEQRLVRDLGFTKVDHEWLVAWDCKRRPDKPLDRQSIAQRRIAREHLLQLAQAVQAHRQRAPGSPLPTAAGLAEASTGAEPLYRGPLLDPWGHAYAVRKRPAGSRVEVRSPGPDGRLDTDDDVFEIVPPGRR